MGLMGQRPVNLYKKETRESVLLILSVLRTPSDRGSPVAHRLSSASLSIPYEFTSRANTYQPGYENTLSR